MADNRERGPRLPPRWFIRLFWSTHRAIYRVTGGRLGLWRPKPGRWGTLRLTTTGRRTGRPRSIIVGYLEDGPNLVTLAMNGWADPEPAWWRNLQAQPEATVELVGEGPCGAGARRPGSGAVASVGPLVRHRPAHGRLCGQTVGTDGGGDPGTATAVALTWAGATMDIRHQETTGTPRWCTRTPVGTHAWTRPPPGRVATSSACGASMPTNRTLAALAITLREQPRMNPTSRQNDGALPSPVSLPSGCASRRGRLAVAIDRLATSLPQEGSGLQAGGELWSWGRRCCSM